MSSWTYINGVITISSPGRTQAEARYILETVIDHLPKVTGSERDMNTYIIQKNGHSSSSSHDEFFNRSNLANGRHGFFEMQDYYMVVVDASLRDREFEQTFKEFQKWLCRFSKRINVENVLVKINGFEKEKIITNENDVYGEMYELPSWCNDTGEPAWYEYLVWEHGVRTPIPLAHAVKYYNNYANDEEFERRLKISKER